MAVDDGNMGAKKSRPNGFEGVLIHGSQKFKFELPGLHCSLKDLSDIAYELTQVPSSCQRLIHKGKSLAGIEKSLAECGLKNGAKILLIGKKVDLVEESLISSINKIAKDVNTTVEKFEEIEKDFLLLQQGYLTNEQSCETADHLGNDLKVHDEKLMKCLENLDSMDIDTIHQEARAKRRALVKKIQKLHDDIDALENKLKEYRIQNGI